MSAYALSECLIRTQSTYNGAYFYKDGFKGTDLVDAFLNLCRCLPPKTSSSERLQIKEHFKECRIQSYPFGLRVPLSQDSKGDKEKPDKSL
jgi:hypothetical protein